MSEVARCTTAPALALVLLLMLATVNAAASPQVDITQPAGGENVSGTMGINGTASDAVSNITEVTLNYSYSSGGGWNPMPGNATLTPPDWNYTWNTTSVPDGVYRLNATAYNETSGTNSTVSNTFSIDNTKPSVTSKSPTTTISDVGPNISANFSDAGSGIDSASVELVFNGTDVTSDFNTTKSSSGISHQASGLSDGTYGVTLNVSDALGNTNSTTWSFTVDTGGGGGGGVPTGNYTGNRVWDASETPPLNHTWDYRSFGGFYYDWDSGLGTEEMTVFLTSNTSRTIPENKLVYETSTANVSFDRSAWGKFRVIGFMGNKYFAGYSASLGNSPFDVDRSLLDRGRLSKVLIDDDKSRNMYVGKNLELEGGYKLRIIDVDVAGDQAWIELYREGELVDSAVESSGTTYVYERGLGGVNDVPVVAARVGNVFQGEESSLVTIDGIFQISVNLKNVETGEDFGEMTVDTTSTTTLEMVNEDDLKLSKGKTVDIFGNVALDVADNSTLRFAPTSKGVSTVRGTIADGNRSWNVNDFEGFFYDIDEDVGGETLQATVSDRDISAGGLAYTTTASDAGFDYDGWGDFEVIGFLAEKYFAGYTGDPDFTDAKSLLSEGRLSRVLIDSDGQTTVYQGKTLGLKDGYALKAVQVDVSGDSAMIELYRDGSRVNGSTDIVESGKSFSYSRDVGDVDNLPLIAVHVDSVFRGGETSVLVIDGVFQISEDLKNVEEGEDFGKMEVDTTSKTSLGLENDEGISLSRDSSVSVMGDVSLRTADTSSLSYAPTAKKPSEAEPGDAVSDEEAVQKPLNVTATPRKARVGAVVEILVTSNSTPVESLSVHINADPVGQTDGNGKLLYTPNTVDDFAVTVTGEGYEGAETTFSASRSGIFVEKPDSVVAGENFTLLFTDADGEPLHGVSVNVDDAPVGTADGDGELTHRIGEAGVYSLSANMDDLETLVTDLRVYAPASLRIVNVLVPDVSADRSATFKVVVENPGGFTLNRTLSMRIGNRSIDNRTISLEPGQVATVTFEHTFGSNLWGSPEEDVVTVGFDGRAVDVPVGPNSTKRAGAAGVIVVLLLAAAGAGVLYVGPETLRRGLEDGLEAARSRAGRLREQFRERFGGEGEEEPFIGIEDLDEGDEE